MGKTTTASPGSPSLSSHLLKNTMSSQRNRDSEDRSGREVWIKEPIRFLELVKFSGLCWEVMKRWRNVIFITSLSSAALFNEHLSPKGSLFTSGYMSADFAVMSDRWWTRLIYIIRMKMWPLNSCFLLLLLKYLTGRKQSVGFHRLKMKRKFWENI